MFFHCFEERALRFGGCAIYFIDQHYLRKERTAMKDKALFVPIKNGIAENVRRKQIARELDPLKAESERACREVLSLPLYPQLDDAEVDAVVEAVLGE